MEALSVHSHTRLGIASVPQGPLLVITRGRIIALAVNYVSRRKYQRPEGGQELEDSPPG